MTIFSPQLSNAEKHLLYLANDNDVMKKSPVDVNVRFNAAKANQSVFDNVICSTIDGAFTTAFAGLGISSIYPFIPISTRATVMGATYEKVCDAAPKNLENIANVFDGIQSSITGASESIVAFIDSFGLPCKELPFTGKDSKVGGWIQLVNTYFKDWKKALDGDIKLWTAASKIQDKDAAAKKAAEAVSTFVGPRTINYLGSAIEMANWMMQTIHESTYGYYVIGAVVGGLAAWSFAQNLAEKEPAEKQAVDRLSFNFDKMVQTLQEMKERSDGSRSVIMKEELKNIAQGILDNQVEIYGELSALNLSKLDYDKQKALMKNLLREAQTIVDNFEKPEV